MRIALVLALLAISLPLLKAADWPFPKTFVW